MGKILVLLFFCVIFAQISFAKDMQGTATLTGKETSCRIAKSRVSNMDGDVSFSLSANCEGVKISGRLDDASAVGDGRSIRYEGALTVDGKPEKAEIIISLADDRTSNAAVAAGGFVFDLGKLSWKENK